MISSRLEPNLAALRQWLPRVAELIESTAVPSQWQLEMGTDGTPTYCRRDEPNGNLYWLGRTSMPAASAVAMVASLDPGSVNGLGLGIGTGYEWLAFIERLTADQVIYVYEPDAVLVRMVLTVCDFGAAMASGRILVFTGPIAGEELSNFLTGHPGFEPPSVIHPLPTLESSQRNTMLAQAEAMIRQVVIQRSEKTAEALALLDRMPAPTDLERRLILAVGQGGSMQRSLRHGMHAYAKRHPGKAQEFLIDSHSSAGLLGRIEAAIKHQPAIVISDLFRSELGPCIPPHVPVQTWVPPSPHFSFWSGISAAAQSTATDKVICHSAEHQELLQTAGAGNVKVLPIAIPAENIPPVQTAMGGLAIRHSIALLGDLPSMDPEMHGATLPSHVAVWNAARDLILEDPLSIHTGMLADLFRRAQARAGVQIIDEQLADSIGRAIRHVLAVSGVGIGLARLLCDAGFNVRCIGSGWETPETQGLQLQVTPTPTTVDLSELWNGVSILLHYNAAGIVHPLLLHAACADVAIVAPEYPKNNSLGGIGTLFETDKHYVTASRRNTLQAIKDLARDGTKRRTLADRTRAHVAAHHTWDCRLDVV